jgi:hypothetical protein
MTGDLSMSNVLKEVLAANEKYAANFGDKGKLAMPKSILIYGYIYDVKSGKLIEVPEATWIGKAA